MLNKFDSSFNTHLRDFLANLWKNSRETFHRHMSNLCVRIDFNQFYLSERKEEEEEDEDVGSFEGREEKDELKTPKKKENKGELIFG